MSENHVAEPLSEGNGATGSEENQIGYEYQATASDPHQGHDHATRSPSKSTTDADQEDVTVAINQIEGFDRKEQDQGDTDDGKSVEDTARDDMFVDCPDELSTLDGKQTDIKEEGAAGENEKEKLEENQALQQQLSHFAELSNGVGDGYLTGELEQLRHTLQKTAADKESIEREYKEEREYVAQGLLDLHSQLKALTCQQSLPYEAEVGGRELADFPLKETIKECLELVKTASQGQTNTEDTISNLQSLLSMKDHEIEDLNAKLAQLSVSNDNSVQKTLEFSSESQLEKECNIEIVIDKMMSSLAAVFNEEQVFDYSIGGKVVYIEKATNLLIEKYNLILSEIYQLGQSVLEVGLDTTEWEYGNILVAARDGLLELKRKEVELVEKLAQVEDENRRIVEELDKERVLIGTLNTELGNLKIELEQEKIKCANTKEKLSMAVTKGKALVQQRDSLKKSLADKSRELERCLNELQEKTIAIEAAQLTKEELARSEIMIASLQNSLLQSNTIIQLVEEILAHAEPDQPEMPDIPDRLRWLVDDRNVLKGTFQELCKVKDAISLLDLPEAVSSSDLESQMNWLKDSFHRARDDTGILQEEISLFKEASCNYIDRLCVSLLLELQEKDYLQSELTDLRLKNEELVGKNRQISLEKGQIVNMLVEISGINLEDKGIDQSPSSTSLIVDLCFQTIKGQSGPFSRKSDVDAEFFERIQSLLYVRDQGLLLYEDMLEEEMVVRTDVDKLSNQFKVASEEIQALKEERDSLLKDLERSEEKSVMLRDKLSMAVKKGKGLVQDRDNLKGLINEKNLEIEQLKLDLQKQESAVSEYRDQINRLSSDIESFPKLEADLLEMKREKNQFEQLLLESNNMLQIVMECIDGISLQVDPVLGEPIEKVKWLAGYVSKSQDANVHLEEELQQVKEEATMLEIKLAEAQATVKSLEQGLSSSEDSISQLAEEKRELELGKARVDEELQKVNEKLSEVSSTTQLLEDALSQAENDISVLSNEKEQVQVGRVVAETELDRVKEESTRQTSKLAEASRTIKDLEDKLSESESNVNLLTEKYIANQVVKTNMDNELKKLQDDAENQASELVDASATIKSLEGALLKAQDDISSLEDSNKIAGEEISSLTFRLNSCMDELAGKNGTLESRSVELIVLLNDLQVLMKDNTLFSGVKNCFERKYETLKNMDLILKKIQDRIIDITAKDSERHLKMEDPLMRKAFLDDLENFSIELDSIEINGTDIDSIISSFGKIVKGFQLRNKQIEDKFHEFSNSIDELISPLWQKLLETETNLGNIVENMETMKEKENTMEKLKEVKEDLIATLQNDIRILLSACTEAASELQIEVDEDLVRPDYISEVEKISLHADAQAESCKSSKYMETTQKLINAARKAQTVIRQFEFRNEQVAATIEDLQNELKETTAAFETVTDERDVNKNRVLQLESDVQLLQCACDEFKNKLEGYHALEEKLKEKEAEILSVQSTLLAKEQEAGSSLLSASEVRAHFDKIDRIKFPIVESEDNDMQPHTSASLKRLFYIIDSLTRLHHQINSVSHDKEELQLALKTKILEIEDLKEEVKQLNRNCEDSKNIKNELFEITFALGKVMDILGAGDLVVSRKSTGAKELIPALENQIKAILLESENSKSTGQELGIKLVASQKLIDELTTKVKLLEDSLQNRTSQSEIVQERSIFEAIPLTAGSEITEVEEGSLGKKAISPVPPAAHVRNMRKGSTDHLALDIEVESDQLINNADTDEDKGHVFKSLNTSGFVPKQGKFIADRIDGIWVSGGRVLMSRPRTRLGLIGYLLIMHVWLLGTLL